MINDIKSVARKYAGTFIPEDTFYRSNIIQETANTYETIRYYDKLRRDNSDYTYINNYLLQLPEAIWRHVKNFAIYIPAVKDYCDVYDAPRENYNRKWFCSQILNRIGDMYIVRFIGWSAQWNERVPLSSGRIQKRYTTTTDWRIGLKPGYRVDILIMDENSIQRIWYSGIILYRDGENITIIIKTKPNNTLPNRHLLLRRRNFYIYILENIKIYDERITRSGCHCSITYIKNNCFTVDDLEAL